MAKKIKRDVMEVGIDTDAFGNCRTAMAMLRAIVEDELGDSVKEDLKMKGLLDMGWGLVYDVIDLDEQRTECLNILLNQNKILMKKLDDIESKMK